MPTTNQLNRNVGIGGLDLGLCMIASGGGPGLFDISVSEAGLQEATIRFATFDPGRWRPARKTPCTEFISGNAQTTAALALFPYLAAQSAAIRVNSEGDGISGVDVLVQGAIFDISLTSAPIVAIPISNMGEYESLPLVMLSGGGEITPASVVARLKLKTRQFGWNGGTGFHVGDVVTLVGGVFDRPATIRVDGLGTGGSIKVEDGGNNHVVDRGKYSVLPANTCAVSGGHGSGATVDITWELGYIDVVSGGSYDGVPTANLVGGDPVITGALGAVQMGQRSIGGDELKYTTPFDPITTTKDTVDIPINKPADGGGTSAPPILQARIKTNVLNGQYGWSRLPRGHGLGNPDRFMEFIPFGGYGIPLGPVDGVTLNVGDKVLFDDGSIQSGLYVVQGTGGPPYYANWVLERSPELDQGAEVLAKPKIVVAEGSGAGTWQVTNESTVFAPFTFDTDPITFESTGTGGDPGSTPIVVGKKATIEYHAIELSFEYVARDFASFPRFLKDEYQLNAQGELLVDPVRARTMRLDIDSVVAVQQLATVDANGNMSGLSDGPVVAISPDEWRSAIKYVGTAAQFEQTPAGAYFHVKETTTIKIVPIVSPGSIGIGTRPSSS